MTISAWDWSPVAFLLFICCLNLGFSSPITSAGTLSLICHDLGLPTNCNDIKATRALSQYHLISSLTTGSLMFFSVGLWSTFAHKIGRRITLFSCITGMGIQCFLEAFIFAGYFQKFWKPIFIFSTALVSISGTVVVLFLGVFGYVNDITHQHRNDRVWIYSVLETIIGSTPLISSFIARYLITLPFSWSLCGLGCIYCTISFGVLLFLPQTIPPNEQEKKVNWTDATLLTALVVLLPHTNDDTKHEYDDDDDIITNNNNNTNNIINNDNNNNNTNESKQRLLIDLSVHDTDVSLTRPIIEHTPHLTSPSLSNHKKISVSLSSSPSTMQLLPSDMTVSSSLPSTSIIPYDQRSMVYYDNDYESHQKYDNYRNNNNNNNNSKYHAPLLLPSEIIEKDLLSINHNSKLPYKQPYDENDHIITKFNNDDNNNNQYVQQKTPHNMLILLALAFFLAMIVLYGRRSITYSYFTGTYHITKKDYTTMMFLDSLGNTFMMFLILPLLKKFLIHSLQSQLITAVITITIHGVGYVIISLLPTLFISSPSQKTLLGPYIILFICGVVSSIPSGILRVAMVNASKTHHDHHRLLGSVTAIEALCKIGGESIFNAIYKYSPWLGTTFFVMGSSYILAMVIIIASILFFIHISKQKQIAKNLSQQQDYEHSIIN